MSSRTAQILCLLLTLATLVVRTTGIDFGVPVWEEPDPDIVGHVDLAREGWTTAVVESPEEQYPHFVADVARLLPRRPSSTGESAPATVEEHLAAAAFTHVQVREIVAAFGVLLVPLVFVLARRFVRDGWALFAAALVATSLLHQSFSQQARPHAVATTLMTATLVASLGLVRTGSWRAYLAAGGLAALSLGSLHNALAILLPGLAAHALRGGGARFFDRKLLAPIALCALAVPVFYPFLFGEVAQPRDVEGEEVRFAEHAVKLSQFQGRGFRVVGEVLWNYEPVLTVLVLAALAAFAISRRVGGGERREWLVLLAFAVPYFVVIGLFERTYERFVLPLIPCLAVIAACGLQVLGERLSAKLAATLAVLALVVPAAATVQLARLRTQPDTFERAARWFSARPDAASERVYLSATAPALDLPLLRRPEGLLFYGKKPKLPLSPWTAWQARNEPLASLPAYDLRWLTLPRGNARPESLGAYLESLAPALFVIEVYEQRKNHPFLVKLREELRARGERLARFSPDRDPEATELELFFQLSDHFNDDEQVEWPHFTARLLQAEAIGPVLEVWRIQGR
jgi:hypothetical protein